ncbi:TIGR04283 family arsenosugar biosynthesis glycosyltransferase [Paramaledivibacter caminithermalis]|jgi:rSAM/selenodomain-associated transferase 2|uniref:4,4'-diaponeurosporenoate glycosyltransferase n=1 Tax=Paramaledivibacter caminithermalis (strain DSM 15212 / CIP 107654 / DViRD3) TaxID=1121301 RepID=A0A1M6MY23_PARC5|nr:TIGR04283 family arsenosugar biosynthesis glycosyltransferase [Paramaledivibacter caminithermalis]SHJ88338.1 transferase 2, rSAM/selenodomain-associated [Paramaledivibacter caminithermalis DSM 15212]
MISIIVPVLNEEKSIENLLIELDSLKGEKEIIVVDGGSHDKTVEKAFKYAKVIHSEKGRAKQMNEGAKVALGDILWFLHSDSKVHNSSLEYIERAIHKGSIGGGFSLYFYDYDSLFMKFVAKTSNLRAKFLGLIFGDQGIFVKRDVFTKIGGYPDIELMEDWKLSKKLYKSGKVSILSLPIGTSARRFKNGGQLKTLLLMHKIKILYVLGVSPSKLKEIYREAR